MFKRSFENRIKIKYSNIHLKNQIFSSSILRNMELIMQIFCFFDLHKNNN